jgi:hypothetical protein
MSIRSMSCLSASLAASCTRPEVHPRSCEFLFPRGEHVPFGSEFLRIKPFVEHHVEQFLQGQRQAPLLSVS